MSPLRTLLALPMTLLTCGLIAQPFTVQLSGTVPACAPNSVVEIYVESGLLQTVVAVDDNCTFNATFEVFLPIGTLSFYGSCSNSATAYTFFNFEFAAPGDTLFASVALVCGSSQVDCLGVTGGTAFPGHPCDDGSPQTVLDLWSADCQCVGLDSSQVVFDCLGIPNGHNLPGSPCLLEDLNSPFPIGLWSADCQCLPDSIFGSYTDCLGVTNGPAVAGSPCDDGNDNTPIDLWDASCQCVGYDSSAVVFDCLGVAFGGALPGAPCLVDSLPFFSIGVWDSNCTCVPDTTIGTVDCLGIAGGGNVPGTPCFTGINELPAGFWSTACECVPDSAQILYFDCTGIPNGPNVAGASCSFTADGVTFGPGIWNTDCVCIADTSAGPLDCAGIPNGPNQPGTPCFDISNPIGIGFWDLNCTCVIDTTNAPVDCLGIPGGPNMPGMPCSLLPDSSNTVVGVWGPDCICYANTFDCLGLPGGSNLPGTPCQSITLDGTPYEGVWGTDCFCYGDSSTFVLDCLGQPNGPNVPGAPCVAMDTLGPVLGIWDPSCACVPDTTVYIDCAGVPNGTNLPNTPCNDGDPATAFDLWDGNCTCIGYSTPPCEAGFEVLPSAPDTTGGQPITLWIINTSFGGSAAFSYLWDFGDGATSTDMFPIHSYAGFGPYELCLTVDDGNGCTDTSCDTIGLDSNGFFRSGEGFTVAVMQISTGTGEEAGLANAPSLWPNPAQDELNIAFSAPMEGAVDLALLDLSGRVVRTERIGASMATYRMAINDLPAGVHLLRATGAGGTHTLRFVKVD